MATRREAQRPPTYPEELQKPARSIPQRTRMDWTGSHQSTSLSPMQFMQNLSWTLQKDWNSGRNFRKIAVRMMVQAQIMQKCPKRNFARAFLAKGPRRSAYGNSKRRPKASNVPQRAPKTSPKQPPKDPESRPKRAPKPPPKQASLIYHFRARVHPILRGSKRPQTLQIPKFF